MPSFWMCTLALDPCSHTLLLQYACSRFQLPARAAVRSQAMRCICLRVFYTTLCFRMSDVQHWT